jgi:hypothetical protein
MKPYCSFCGSCVFQQCWCSFNERNTLRWLHLWKWNLSGIIQRSVVMCNSPANEIRVISMERNVICSILKIDEYRILVLPNQNYPPSFQTHRCWRNFKIANWNCELRIIHILIFQWWQSVHYMTSCISKTMVLLFPASLFATDNHTTM